MPSVSSDLFVAGRWLPGEGEPLRSHDPSTGETVHDGRAATPAQVAAAVGAARAAFGPWSDREVEERAETLRRFAGELTQRRDVLANAISRETGKPRWEARTEVDAMVGKVAISVEAQRQRAGESRQVGTGGVETIVRHRPHGVCAVLGPFNFPGHLPNGHIVPALLAGNTVVFKPSERTPAVAAATLACWEAAGLPPGVLNLIQGERETARALAGHPDLDGLFFTGSAEVGAALHRQFAGRPEAILALEMGGNNALVVLPAGSDVAGDPSAAGGPDPAAAVELTLLSAYQTAGQRCTCARRLVVVEGTGAHAVAARAFLDLLVRAAGRVRVGPPDAEPEPFMGPLIHADAARAVLDAQERLLAAGARPLRPAQAPAGLALPFLAPGLLDVTDVPIPDRPDAEIFGPLLQVVRVPDFDAALVEVNRTRFGLAAGLLGGGAAHWERFRRRVRVGVLNWNRPLTGASSAAPFGGVGRSGNGRPSAFYAADYCAFPVASLETDVPRRSVPASPGLRWSGSD